MEISGYYCKKHEDLALDTLKSEIKDVMIFKNAEFWIFIIAVPAITVLYIIVLIALNARKKKQQGN